MNTTILLSKPRRRCPRPRIGARSLKSTRLSLEDALETICADVFGVPAPARTGAQTVPAALPVFRS